MTDQRDRELPADRAAGGPLGAEIPPDAPAAIRAALAAAEHLARPGELPVRIIHPGEAIAWHVAGELRLEDGAALRIRRGLPPDLPLGYHDFFDGEGRRTRIIVAPRRCLLPTARQWGWTVQLYAARSAHSWGLGDLADLGRVAAWARDLGAQLLLVSPLCAAAPVLPQVASPYYPSTRRFLSPMYLRIEEVPGAARLGSELPRLAAAGRALCAVRRVDRDAVFRLKREALHWIWAGFTSDADFDQFCTHAGPSLELFATWCLLAENHGGDWRQWPAQYRDPLGRAVQAAARENPRKVRYHQWLQWLLDRQLARASAVLPLVQDLPIGMDPGGFDAWQWQDLLAKDCTIGAPPDQFNSLGQNWQLPPLVPARLRQAAYEPFVETIRATLRHACGLRIDHVMGLFRLWWIAAGSLPAQGIYVPYPADDLLDIVALESHRAGAFVVGEDLGTVQQGVRQQLAERQILSTRLLWFEADPPSRYPQLSLTTPSTHDLPTVAGMWSGFDRAAQEQLGLPHNEEMRELRRRLGKLIDVPADAPIAEVIRQTYRVLARAPSLLLLASLEDALAVEERPNMPGTTTQWPNWSLALPGGLEALEAAPLPRQIARALSGVA
ncbi:MAG: 4-alpha-glucanotransferase [Thermoguttaceae bacterium]|jgi:4-alpha-glucanotransferase